jgi:hypothetical protein
MNITCDLQFVILLLPLLKMIINQLAVLSMTVFVLTVLVKRLGVQVALQ